MTDLLVAHMGSIELDELDSPLIRLQAAERYPALESRDKPPNHLHLLGTFFLLHQLRPQAAIVSEFGEEMKEIWIKAIEVIGSKLGEVLQASGRAPLPVFAGDPFIIYNILEGTFLCHETQTFEPPGELRIVEHNDPRRDGSVAPRRPYLFKKNPAGTQSAPDRQGLLIKFHEALKDRNLPHFRD